jgi:signal transduction histidine kinase/ligand-binding sensor domain-containing protein/DNA-binding response OmpR family regulator
MKPRIFISVLTLLASTLTSAAQETEPRFGKITSEDGISQSEVYSFLQDSEGFMWLGTLHGLNRYDGYGITRYGIDRNQPNSLTHNTIHALVEDRFSRKWIGTDNGLNLLDYTIGNGFRLVKLPSRTVPIAICSLLVDGDILWIGTNDGLFRVDISSRDIATIEASVVHVELEYSTRNPDKRIRSLLKGSGGTLWVGYAAPAQVICLNYDPAQNIARIVALPEALRNHSASAMLYDMAGNIWIGGRKSLARYNPANGDFDRFMPGGPGSISSVNISSLAMDFEGNIWVGTRDSGLNRIDYSELQNKNIYFEVYRSSITNPSNLNSDLIYSLYISPDDILWVGTIGNGVDYYDLRQKSLRHYLIPPEPGSYIPSSNFIRAVYLDGQDRLWLGSHNNGLYRLDRRTGKYRKLGFGTAPISNIYPFEGDTHLICSLHGIYVWRDDHLVRKIAQITNVCYNAESSSPGVWWVASIDGIYRVETSDGRDVVELYSSSTPNGVSRDNCRVVKYQASTRSLWVGTEGGGLNRIWLDGQDRPIRTAVYQQGQANALSNSYVRTIHIQGDSIVWAGTYDGLNRITAAGDNPDSLSFRSYYQRDGLPSSMIQSVISDNDGNIWIGSNRGLSRLDTRTMAITNFTSADGLQSNEFSGHSCFLSDDGELFFGGINGANSFYPNQISTDRPIMRVVITSFYLGGERITQDEQVNRRILLRKPIFQADTLRLKPNENDIRFDFSAMSFTSQSKVRYRYKLDGYDRDWIVADIGDRVASYTNLPYGKYYFQVMAAGGDGRWSNPPASIHLYIRSPLLLSTVAYIIYFLLVVAAIFYFTRYSIIKNTTKKQIRLENEHNRRLHELDSLRTRFFINISHDLRTPLTLILGPLEQIVRGRGGNRAEIDRKVASAYNSAYRLRYLVEQLLDFRKVEAGKEKLHLNRVEINLWMRNEANYFEPMLKEKGLKLHYSFPSEESEVLVDCRKLSKIVFNLMSNAIKFTTSGSVEVALRIDDARVLHISITDTGIGIAEDKLERIFDRFFSNTHGESYGIGLSHCKDLAEAMGGVIAVESAQGKGSRFTVSIPLGNAADDSEITALESHVKPVSLAPSAAVSRTGREAGRCNILVVDDNAEMRDHIAVCLGDKYNIFEAPDGTAGLNAALEEEINLVISDVMMPGMNGLELCNAIKQNVATSHIPVILLTAKTDPKTQYAGLEMGADDYISKPFDMDMLLARVQSILDNRQRIRLSLRKQTLLDPSQIAVTSTDEKFLTKLMELIEHNIADTDFLIEDMEKGMHMSRSNFLRKVKALTGMSGKELLQEVRLRRAAELLASGKLAVSEAAYMAGFSDPKYFGRCFRQRYKASPSGYRKQHTPTADGHDSPTLGLPK